MVSTLISVNTYKKGSRLSLKKTNYQKINKFAHQVKSYDFSTSLNEHFLCTNYLSLLWLCSPFFMFGDKKKKEFHENPYERARFESEITHIFDKKCGTSLKVCHTFSQTFNQTKMKYTISTTHAFSYLQSRE